MGAYEKEDGAGSAWWLLLLIVPLFAALAGGLYLRNRAAREEAFARMHAERAREEAVAQLEAHELMLRKLARPDPPAKTAASAGARQTAVPGAPAVQSELPASATLWGRVLDEFGSPVPDVGVVLHRQREPEPDPRLDRDFEIALAARFGRPGAQEVRTDAIGRFEFDGYAQAEGDSLGYGRELYSSGEPRAEVLLDGMEQVLRLPPLPNTIVIVDVVDQEGAPVDPSLARARRLRGKQELVRNTHHPRNVRLESGRVSLLGLGEGEWEIMVRGLRSTPAIVRAVLEPDTDTLHLEARVRNFGGDASWLTRSLAEVAEPVTTPDAENGFAAWSVQGQRRRGFRDRRSNRYFIHTISGFGAGPVRAAFVELHLRAQPDDPTNDTLHLEFRGPGANPRFEWSRRIDALAGVGSWTRGKSTWIVLDLAALPTDDGSLDLLEHLEDGHLDVLVTDDTSVEDLALQVLP